MESGLYLLFKITLVISTAYNYRCRNNFPDQQSKAPHSYGVKCKKYGLSKDSVILLEQIRTIDKKRLKEKIGHLDDELMAQVDEALGISFGIQFNSNLQEVNQE